MSAGQIRQPAAGEAVAVRDEGSIRLLAMAGDGIGPEIVRAALQVLQAARDAFELPVAIEEAEVGWAALQASGSTVPDTVVERARAADGLILGPVSHNDYPPLAEGGLNPSGVLRKALDLFANIRPARTWQGLASPLGRPFDLVIVRENTEGFYADRTMVRGTGEFMPTPDLALAVRKVTAEGSRRIAEAAFALARRRRRQVTAVHKANVLRLSDGFFLDHVRAVAAGHPDIFYEERLVDAMAAWLIREPSRFDVIVTTNMFGDILSDEASELAGGLGLAASLNAGAWHAMAQAQHGSAPDIAGRDIANPASLIGSVAMLLRWLADRPAGSGRFAAAADAIDAALAAAIARPETRTRDLGGALGTAAFGAHVAGLVQQAGQDGSRRR
jgi:isocitrate/isopropylmalate dehydrogenase